MPNKLTQEEFIKRSKEIHGDKYDYSKVEYKNCNVKVCIICPKHGEFWQTPLVHIYGGGCGCKECRKDFLHEKFKTNKSDFIEKAKKTHGDKYDYSEFNYVNAHHLGKIICPEHGVFFQVPNSHLKGRGCPECAKKTKGKKISQSKRLNTSDFINRAIQIHGDKYDYSKVVYEGIDKKVCISCFRHGEFWQRPSVHLKGSGCPKCKESSLEKEVFDFLSKKNVIFETEKTFPWLKNKINMYLDFFIPESNIAIECQGDQHFIPVCFGGKQNTKEDFENIKKRDKLKNNICEKNGIKIFYYFHSSYFLDAALYNENNVIRNLNDIRLQ